MTGSIALLLACLLAGEILSRGLGVPIPGSVIGMGLLLLWLAWRSRPSPGLEALSRRLISYLPLMFVPAAVGIMQQGPLLMRHGLAIGLALVVSTLATLTVTAWVFRALTAKGTAS